MATAAPDSRRFAKTAPPKRVYRIERSFILQRTLDDAVKALIKAHS